MGGVDTRFVLPPEVEHHIGKDRTQRLERTNGILRYSNWKVASQLRTSLGSSGSKPRSRPVWCVAVQLDVETQSVG